MIDLETVRHVARLARLDLTDAELEKYRAQLDAMLDYVKQLDEMRLDGVEPMAHAGDFADPVRADAVKPGLATDAALAAAPERVGNFFGVPKVIE